MSSGFDRSTDLYEPDRLDPPSGRSTWIALAVIVAALITILVVLSIVGDLGPNGPPSSLAEVPSAK